MNIAKKKSIAQIAKEELQAELESKGVEKLKNKYKELHGAKLVVKNLEREIEDLEEVLAEEIGE